MLTRLNGVLFSVTMLVYMALNSPTAAAIGLRHEALITGGRVDPARRQRSYRWQIGLVQKATTRNV